MGTQLFLYHLLVVGSTIALSVIAGMAFSWWWLVWSDHTTPTEAIDETMGLEFRDSKTPPTPPPGRRFAGYN